MQTLKTDGDAGKGAGAAPAPPAAADSAAEPQPALAWLEHLRDTWQRAAVGGPAPPAAAAAARCIDDAMASIDAMAADGEAVEVLVTGSLYLVGDVLKHLNGRR